MKKTAEQRKVPVLRFPEFTGEWAEKRLGELCSVGTGNKDTQNRIDGGRYPFFVRSNTVERINSFSYDGEAILTSGDGVGVGKNFHYINGKFDYHQRVYCLKEFDSGISGRFIFSVFSDRFYRRVIRLSAKNSVDSVRMSMITDMKVKVPSLSEQKKISDFILSIDRRIEGLEKKRELLKEYKKGLMQKLFNQSLRFGNGNQPFPEWEEKRLGEIGSFFKGKGVSKNDISENGKTECIRYGELYTHYGEQIVDVRSRTDVGKSELVLSEENDVIIPSSGETQIDIATASCIRRGGIAIGGDLNIIRTPHNGVFLAYYLNNMLKNEIARLAQGVSVIHLYLTHLKSLKILLPHFEEQRKIADFLSALDRKIKQVETQVARTREFKQGLLQKMFV